MHDEITLAHLSDVHLGPIRGFAPRYWNLKRLTGYLNWMRHRRHDHSRDVADRLVADALAHHPDHIAITGDLANIGLPQEHADALVWLSAVGAADDVTVVPGNHDIYARIGSDIGTARWSDYMMETRGGSTKASRDALAVPFPFVRRLGWLAIVGVNSAVTTPPLAAWGRVGESQRLALARILDALGSNGLVRVVLIHHPPLMGQADRLRHLQDAKDFEHVLIRHGAEIVLHGHNHRNMLEMRTTAAGGNMAVVGVPSASLRRSHKNEPAARYNLLRLSREPPGARSATGPPAVRVELVGRGLAEPDGPLVELERRTLGVGGSMVPSS
jgi:3',5'-cyclic AMP phosphodiesterase CpdA